MTIEDLEEASGIDAPLIEGVEQRRRKFEGDQLTPLAEALGVTEDDVRRMTEFGYQDGQDRLIEAIRQFGNFGGASFKSAEGIQAFVYLMNDIWRLLQDEGSNAGTLRATSAHELVDQWKGKMFKAHVRGQSESSQSAVHEFPFTIPDFSSPSAVCWVRMVPSEVSTNSQNTVILTNVSGISVQNNLEEYVKSLVDQILVPFDWISEKDAKKGRYAAVRFYVEEWDRHQVSYREIRTDKKSFEVHGDYPLPIRSHNGQVESSRKYRLLIDAKKLPDPFKVRDGDDRCQPDRTGACPIVSGQVPSNANGCQKCRDIARAWEGREFLVSRIGDEGIRGCSIENELLEKHPDVYVEFTQHFGLIEESEISHFYNIVHGYGMYELRGSSIDVSERGYTDGRHRTQIARNMKIRIPCHFSTQKRMMAELMEPDV